MANAKAINIDDLLEMDLDDLADLPEFKPFPAGAHLVNFTWEMKEVNEARCLEIKLKAIETQELANLEDAPLEAGAETSVLYQLDNEFAQGKLKPIVKALALHHGTSKFMETLEASQGMELVAVTKIRNNKEKTQQYTDLASVIV